MGVKLEAEAARLTALEADQVRRTEETESLASATEAQMLALQKREEAAAAREARNVKHEKSLLELQTEVPASVCGGEGGSALVLSEFEHARPQATELIRWFGRSCLLALILNHVSKLGDAINIYNLKCVSYRRSGGSMLTNARRGKHGHRAPPGGSIGCR